MGLMERAAERLAAERRRALERLAGLTRDYESVVSASRDTNADDEHDPEGATIAFERSQIAALSRHIRGHIEEIDGAFARLETGRYGRCERCGDAIGDDRLDARPTARTCIACARQTGG
jgi:DnaK suppressor protein